MIPRHPDTETFTSVDAAWLHMDSPSNLAIITGVYRFAGPVDLARLRLTVERRLAIYPRFRQRPRPPAARLGLPRWELDPDFDLDYHLQCTQLSPPADQAALQDFVSDLMSQPLDLDHPLWRFYFVDRCEAGSALVCRLHHAMADGLALVQLMLTSADLTPEAPLPELPSEPEDLPGAARLRRLLAPAMRAARAVNGARRLTGTVAHEGLETLAHPTRLVGAARLGASASRSLAKLLLIGPDRRTVLRGTCSASKRAAWTANIALDDVKAVGRLMGGTVNDVLLSAVTGALRRYIDAHRQHTAGLNVRAIVPVNLRPPDDPDLFGNRFGLVFLSLPVGVKDPIKRLMILHRRMEEIKNSPEAVVALNILNVIGLSPIQIERLIIAIFGMKGTAVMTNVPGPRQPLYFAGGKIEQLMFWVPTPGNLGLGVSIISYAGQVMLGVATDAGLIPEPQDLIDAFQDELEALKHWGRPPLRAEEPAPAQAALPAVERCQAVTRAGAACKNRPLPGSSFCRVHQRA